MRTEKTEAGDQAIIADTPTRTVPSGKLRPKVGQTDAPLELECVDQKQGNLLEGK